MPLLQVIVASTRPGRVGRAVGEWFADEARQPAAFEVELIDLMEVGLPFLDEPNHPRLRQYEQEHTWAWSRTIERGDAYAFVMPEYNHGYSAPLKNAIDFLWQEWNDKPAILVGYGGVSGGLRAMTAFEPVLAAVRLHLAAEVPIPFSHRLLQDGRVVPNDAMVQGTKTAVAELARLHTVLTQLRTAEPH